MSNNNHGGFFSGKGFYIALLLCAAAIGVTGYLYSKSADETENVSLLETQEDLAVGPMGTEDVPVLATQPEPATPPATQGPAAAQPPAKAPLKTMSPVTGDAIFGYSAEALSYNQTTRDWRIHNGVDLAAEPGAPVGAAADGEVYTTYSDDAMGYTVVIRHIDGYTTKYASLAEEPVVKPGERVTAGQTIGYASDTAITESTLGSHVHFSVTKQDEPMDPKEFLALGQ